MLAMPAPIRSVSQQFWAVTQDGSASDHIQLLLLLHSSNLLCEVDFMMQ